MNINSVKAGELMVNAMGFVAAMGCKCAIRHYLEQEQKLQSEIIRSDY